MSDPWEQERVEKMQARILEMEAQVERLQNQRKATIDAVPFPSLAASSARTIAWHVEHGHVNGGLTLKALAQFLRSIEKAMTALDGAPRSS